jgi:2'-5' RNA ligase
MILPSDSTLRLFLALWPSGDVRSAMEDLAQRWEWPAAARRTRPERLHATLHFLGTRPAGELPALRERLRVEWTGCELLLDRATVWPGGIAVLEATVVPAALAQLHAELGARLEELVVPVETRPYRPHITLARKAFGARPQSDAGPLPWRVPPGYALVRSLPGGRGYEILQAFG